MRQIIRDKILKRFDNKCVNCNSINNLEIDHVIPVSKGGEHSEHNFQILCKTCNLTKGSKFEYDKYFKKGDGKNFIYLSSEFPMNIKFKDGEFILILNHMFKKYIMDDING